MKNKDFSMLVDCLHEHLMTAACDGLDPNTFKSFDSWLKRADQIETLLQVWLARLDAMTVTADDYFSADEG